MGRIKKQEGTSVKIGRVNYTFYVEKEVSEKIEEKYAKHSDVKKYIFLQRIVEIGLKHFDEDYNK